MRKQVISVLRTSVLAASRTSVTQQAQQQPWAVVANLSAKVQTEIERWDPNVCVEAASTPPSSWFIDPDFYKTEKRAIFTKNWVAVGRVDQVAEPGQYFSGTLADEPYVVVRGNDNILRAFFNVCRHHAAELTPGCGEGCINKFVCPYHGWTYNLEGRLTQAKRLRGIKDFKAKNFGLKPIKVAEFGPLVMINMDEEAREEDLDKNLGEAKNILDENKFNALRWVRRVSYPMSCNWKVFVDNYLDGGYHVEHLHHDLTDNLDIASYFTRVAPHYSLQGVRGAGGDRLGEEASYFFLYPSLMINRYGPWMDTNMVVPTGPTTSKVIYDYFLEEDFLEGMTNKEVDEYVTRSLEASDKVQQEDNFICESVQRGLGSSAYDAGRYAPQVEMADHAFHQTLARQLRQNSS